MRFPHNESKSGMWIAWSFVAKLENVIKSVLHMVKCLIWKFPKGGRRATFLPSNTKWRINDCITNESSGFSFHNIMTH